MKRTFWIIVILAILMGFSTLFFYHKKSGDEKADTGSTESVAETPIPVTPDLQTVPIDRARDRVTKKRFGIYVTPKSSPVQPEKFSGYHSGVDFETFPEEQNTDVPFYAICDGKILQKKTASGYGGILVQSCNIANQAVTVVYGHVSINSISKKVNENLTKGQKIGNLGKSPEETDGERKHLHLGIHKGTKIDITGYVQSAGQLSNWLDFQKLTL